MKGSIAFLGSLLLSALVQAAPSLSIDQGYVRGLPPGQTNTAAFMVLNNLTNQTLTLVGASTSVANKAEFHGHFEDQGMMKMRHVPELVIEAGQSLELKPGSFHLMLMGLKGLLKDGQKVGLKIQQKNGQELDVILPVRSVLNEVPHQHHHH